MLTEHFQISEELHYKLLKLAVVSPNKRKIDSASFKPLNINTMNLITKMMRIKTLKFVLILIVSVIQTNNAYSFAKVISLNVSSGPYSDETVVRIEDQATYAFDGDWDAYKLSNADNTPNFYTSINDINYSINSFPGDFQNYSLNLNLQVAFSGYYTITSTSLLNSSVDCPYTIVLEDKLLGTSTVLAENKQYSFQASLGDQVDRFVLHYSVNNYTQSQIVAGLGSSLTDGNYVDFRVLENGFNINFKNASSSKAAVTVIDMNGKEMFLSEDVSTQSSLMIPIQSSNSNTVYVVKVVVSNTVFNKKLIF